MPSIPGLPADWVSATGEAIDLSVVPPSPAGPDDPERTAKVRAWEAWADEVLAFRHEHQEACDRDPAMQREERLRCAAFGPKYFLTVWCSIYEERPEAGPSEGEWLPAIPFPFQVETLDWFERRLAGTGARANGVVRKARDMGATWMFCLWALHGFLFRAPFSVKFISRNEDVVDTEGDLDAMLQRIKAHLVDEDGNAPLPRWLIPPGWERRRHAFHLRILRPGNRNRLRGESTNRRAGRGGRTRVAGIDEGAHVDDLKRVLAAVRPSAAHTVVISSPSVESGEDFEELCAAMTEVDPDCVLTLGWWLHPYHDLAWYQAKREEFSNDPEGFAREYELNAYAGYGGWYYPNAQEMDVWPEGIAYEPGNPLYLGIDPGDADDCALHWIMCNGADGWDAVLESYERSGPPPEHYAAIILGCDPDAVEAAFPALRFSPLDRDLMAWTRTLPQPVLCGDPAGTQKHAGDSWYDKLQRFALDHNPRRNAATGRGMPLTILVNWTHDARYDQGRRVTTMNWLPRLRFNDTPEVRRTLYAIQRSRFEPEDRPRMVEQKRPVHDALSHRRSALEYVAVNLDVARLVRGRTPGYEAARGTRGKPAKRTA